MTTPFPTPADFQPLLPDDAPVARPRPPRSHWQDVRGALVRNRQAWASLWLIVFLLLFALVGPRLWPVDPSLQDSDRISEGPALGPVTARVVAGTRWPGVTVPDHPARGEIPAARLEAPRELRLAEEATTQGVRLVWTPVPGAATYVVYRNEFRPNGPTELGLPLGETGAGNRVGFQDRLKLEPVRYYYAVVAGDGVEESDRYRLIEVTPRRAIDPERAREIDPRLAPGATVTLAVHPLGLDSLGRDLLARLIHGARTSLFIGLGAPLLFVGLGILYGGLAGMAGGWLDDWMMRLADFVVALPFLLFMILLRVAFGIQSGESGVAPMLAAMVLLGWPTPARLVRGQVLQIRHAGFVEAARLLGVGRWRLLTRHLLPNVMGVALVSLTFAVPGAIFTEAFLSFIGMGVVPPTPSWGSLCQEGLKSLWNHPHELLFPALCISMTVLAFNLFGDGLRDALDVKTRERP
ncbi:MAG: ABC transporter permease [Magnetococcales bacterium]|nr:ABC transporter permease [Magnetococcales bacterium]